MKKIAPFLLAAWLLPACSVFTSPGSWAVASPPSALSDRLDTGRTFPLGRRQRQSSPVQCSTSFGDTSAGPSSIRFRPPTGRSTGTRRSVSTLTQEGPVDFLRERRGGIYHEPSNPPRRRGQGVFFDPWFGFYPGPSSANRSSALKGGRIICVGMPNWAATMSKRSPKRATATRQVAGLLDALAAGSGGLFTQAV